MPVLGKKVFRKKRDFMKYNLYFYDGSKNAVVMTYMEGKELVVECDRAEANVVFDVLEDRGYLVRLAMQEPASYIQIAMKPNCLQDYVDAMYLTK